MSTGHTKEVVEVTGGVVQSLVSEVRALKQMLLEVHALAGNINVGGSGPSAAKMAMAMGGPAGHKMFSDSTAADRTSRLAFAEGMGINRGLMELAASAASPGTTPESRKDAAQARSTASYNLRWGGLTPQQVTQERSQRLQDSVAAADLNADVRIKNLSTAEGMAAVARKRQKLREDTYTARQAAHGGLNDLEWAASQAKFKEQGAAGTQNTLRHRTTLETARETTANARTAYVQEQQELVKTRLADRGGSQMEALAKRQEANRENEEIRKAKRADRLADKQAAKEAKLEAGASGAWGNLIPGMGMAQRVGQYFPSVGKAMGGVSSLLGTTHTMAMQAGAMGGGGMIGGVLAGGAFMGAGIVGGLGMAAGVGELALHKGRQWTSASAGRQQNMEQILRGVYAGGGVANSRSFLAQGELDELAARGYSPTTAASAYAGFLSGKGRRPGGVDADAFGGTREALLTGIDANEVGRVSNMGGYSHGYGLMGAGLSGDSLRAAYGQMRGTMEGAYSLGQTYNASNYTSMARRFAGHSAFGGGEFGGVLATQRLAGLGNNIAEEMVSPMKRIADMMVFAKAAQEGGDPWDIQDRIKSMSVDDKEAAIGSLGPLGKRMIGFSRKQSVVNSQSLADPGMIDPPEFKDQFIGNVATAELAADRSSAREGSTSAAIVKMDSETAAKLTRLVDATEGLNAYVRGRGAAMGWVFGLGG